MLDSKTWEPPAAALTQAAAAVEQIFGIPFPISRRDDLWRGIVQASIELGYPSPEKLAWILARSEHDEAVVDALACHLTVGETYFFREPAGLEMLADHLRAEMAAHTQLQSMPPRRFHLWSAGCCTGEEAYSLSILAESALGGFSQWDAAVLATDVNRRFLDFAQKGIYRNWSFRGVEKWILSKYFSERPTRNYEVDPAIRQRVTFKPLNLADPAPPGLPDENSMDAIVCRNVLMYFSPAKARAVVQSFRRILRHGGVLVVGAVDATMPIYDGYAPVQSAHATIFRKPKESPGSGHEGPKFAWSDTSRGKEKGKPHRRTPRRPPTAVQREPLRRNLSSAIGGRNSFDRASELFQLGLGAQALALAVKEGTGTPPCGRSLSLAARIEANQGNLEAAARWSAAAVAVDKLDPDCNYLHATVLYEAGRLEEAEQALARTLYLAPEFVLAHYMLGLIARAKREVPSVQRHLRNVLAILEKQDDEAEIGHTEGLTVGTLRTAAMKILGLES